MDLSEEELARLARFIAYHPKVRADYFQDADRVLARAIPREGVERILPGVPKRVRDLRRRLADKVVETINDDPRLISTREASSFLSEALRNPQRTFDAIVQLSMLAFVIGAALLIGAFVAAVVGDGTTEKAVLGGLSGGGGAVTTLGAVLLVSRDAIRKANSDDAQIRLILTGFGSEVSHLRAIPIVTLRDAKERNSDIREAMKEAVEAVRKIDMKYLGPTAGQWEAGAGDQQ